MKVNNAECFHFNAIVWIFFSKKETKNYYQAENQKFKAYPVYAGLVGLQPSKACAQLDILLKPANRQGWETS